MFMLHERNDWKRRRPTAPPSLHAGDQLSLFADSFLPSAFVALFFAAGLAFFFFFFFFDFAGASTLVNATLSVSLSKLTSTVSPDFSLSPRISFARCVSSS